MKKLIAKFWDKLNGLLAPIRDKLHTLNKKFDTFFDFSWTLGSLMAKVGFIIQGIFSIIFGIASLIFTIMNFGTLVDIVKGTVQGQSVWLEKLENVVKGYPSFQSLVTSLDSQLSALDSYFSPSLTFTRILNITGIGDAVNTIVVCAVQGVAFVISMRLLFWSLGRVKLQMIKPIK